MDNSDEDLITQINKRIMIQSVVLATRYKDEWAVRAFEAWLYSTCHRPSSMIRHHFLKLELTTWLGLLYITIQSMYWNSILFQLFEDLCIRGAINKI